MSAGTGDLLTRFEDLPARSAAATQVLRLVDDPRAAAPDVARAVANDPKLTARVIGLANSSYYGLPRQVGSLTFAVSLIGFRAIRSLAITAASGLEAPGTTPAGYWDQATFTATACDLLAPLVGADPGDAFTTGLLHTFGTALLHQIQPGPGACLPPPLDPVSYVDTERDLYGIGHAEAAARVLDAWHLPGDITHVIATHHRPILETSPPLARTLAAARSLTALALSTPTAQQIHTAENDLARTTEGRFDSNSLDATLDRLTSRAHTLHEALHLH